MAENRPRGELQELDISQAHQFQIPTKRINEGEDVEFWLTSWAYTDLMTFMLQLNAAMFPSEKSDGTIHAWTLASPLHYSDIITNLRKLVSQLENLIEEAPPDPGPRRFGNVSFRTWYALVEQRLDALLHECLPKSVLELGSGVEGSEIKAKEEIKSYLLGSFGSAQRLDYGTGHELSFIAFLGCIWKLGGFGAEPSGEPFGARERQIVLGVVEP